VRFGRVGLMTPGDMGQAIALQIRRGGYEVCTALEGRSARSRALARAAGLTDLGSIDRLVAQCDVVLSIMNPGAAADFAAAAVRGLEASGAGTMIVDCNAIAPESARAMAASVERAGGAFVDAGIIGAPPRGTGKTCLHVSGPQAQRLVQLAGPQLEISVLSERVGDASALKMCSAALTKGTQALWLEVLLAARRLGVADVLEREVRRSRAPVHDWVLEQFPILAPKAERWVPEMLEIAQTMAAAGITPKVFDGVADIFRHVAGTELARETPEQSRARERSGEQVLALLARTLPPAPPGGAHAAED